MGSIARGGAGSLRRVGTIGALAGVLLLAETAVAQVPGTRIMMTPPAGFTTAQQFPGFEWPGRAAAILVSELPGSTTDVRAGFTAEALASRGMTLLASEAVSVGEQDGRLYQVQQTSAGIVIEKWLLLFGGADRTALIVGTFPQGSAVDLREPIRRALLSARWHSGPPPSPFEGLPFRITESAMLETSGRMANTVMLTRPGATPPLPADEPLLVVGTSAGKVAISDLEAFARRRVQQTAEVTGIANITGEQTTVGTLPAYELLCDAREASSGAALRLYQLVAADGDRYVLVQGMVSAARAPLFVPEFQRIAHSIQLVP
jgi:hypothetical protein